MADILYFCRNRCISVEQIDEQSMRSSCRLQDTLTDALVEVIVKIPDLEVMNSKVTQKENSFAAKVAEGLSLPATGGSDTHEVSEVGIYATQFSHGIKDEKDLIEALKTGEFSPIAFRK